MTADQTLGSPRWIETPGGSLAAHLHRPADGTARGCVVFCSPLGYEMLASHEAFLLLADRLVTAGFAVLRFDYPATADSLDQPPDTDLVPVWERSVAEVVAYARALDAGPVSLVGMRMGATLAAQVRPEGLASIVLWDPCWTGRAFLRQQTALVRLATWDLVDSSPEPPPPLPLQVMASSLNPATLDELRSIRLPESLADLASDVLVLHREEAVPGSHVAATAGVTVEQAADQLDLLEVDTVAAVMPSATIELVAGWLDRVAPRDRRPVAERPGPTAATVDGEGVTETFVALGRTGLFGVVTRPAVPAQRRVLVFFNTAAEVHIGPGRLWVELARDLARHGFVSYRVDLSGIGDSPARPGQPRRREFPDDMVADVDEIVEAVAPGRPGDVTLIGLCSGAYAALAGGMALGIGEVIAINPVLEAKTARNQIELVRADPTAHPKPGAFVVLRRPRWSKVVTRVPAFKRLLHRLPPAVWRLLDGLRLLRSPARAILPVTATVGHTLFILGALEAVPVVRRGGWIVDRQVRQGRLAVDVLPIDHSLFDEPAREHVRCRIRTHLIEGGDGAPTPAGRASLRPDGRSGSLHSGV